MHDKNADELGKLLSAHDQGQAADGWLRFYRGEHALLVGRADFAERHFRAALKLAAPIQRWPFSRGMYRAQVQGGHAVQAYTQAGGTLQAFRDLASICQQDKNAGQLKALIAARRAADPDDPALLSWELQAIWLDGDWAAALAHLDAHADAYAQQPSLRYSGTNYRVRALVKLKRAGDAIRTAEALEKKQRGNRLLLLLAYAAARDAKGAIAVVAQTAAAVPRIRRLRRRRPRPAAAQRRVTRLPRALPRAAARSAGV